MEELMARIKKDMNDKGITISELAKMSSVPYTVVNDGVSTGRTVEMKFDVYLKLVHVIYETYMERRNVVTDFIRLIKSNKNVRKSMCYCYCAGEIGLMEYLLEKHKKNRRLKKYLFLYELLNNRNKGISVGKPLINKIDGSSFAKTDECIALFQLLNMFSAYDVVDIPAMNVYAEKARQSVSELNVKCIKKSLSVYCLLMVAHSNLLDGQLNVCRNNCNAILQASTEFIPIISSNFCCIGESYMFTDKMLSEEYLLKSSDVLEKNGFDRGSKRYRGVQTTLALLYIEHGFNLHKIQFEHIHKAEHGYYEAIYGDVEKGVQMLKEDIAERPYSPYPRYYLAKAEKDIVGLEIALKMFKDLGNHHYATTVEHTLDELKMEV
ncbi:MULTISPECIES: AimR family lysis-lysogeny pheromone receptor [Bacillus cereus group]|uniref:Prophage helix-turn-helix protein n=2 Tax=Bacillus cereus group TaxID=86661 RepID=A0A9X7AY89_BACTU|nr:MULTISPECIES: AimR family lysis-lysogeny pheromone receptor [Bacillus cereus group]MCQ6284879.1 AimR family lysis-lysogeny pheromone receptor [Bacillus cereus]MCQ6305921.1 AimR family lysis-lysogeny pheromone receptor [Bacillus cereus]MCQ6313959.1 AimR family lysis-lysogeny pheromone receptor [Bacillus cereus]MCQ6330334.1 AimR family lysis-lysogeny pheromone receptor [Bacillus cereus]MCQ6381861.1 AimR family lysis-lysogeny pheromone receptor [Bacillus cereus]